MRLCRSTRLILLITIALSSFAWGNEGLDRLRQLVIQNKFSEAFELAQTMIKENNGNPDFDFLYAKAARQAGHPEVAIFALERVIARNPEDVRSLYERALALLDTKDVLGARKVFNRIMELDAPPDIKANSKKLLELTEQIHKSKAKSHELWLDTRLDIGFSNNVNAGTTDPTEFLFQGPAVKDGFVNFNAGFLFEKYLSKDAAIFFSFATDNRKNFRSPYWDYNVFGGRVGAEFAFGRFELRLPFDTEFLLVNYGLLRVMATFAADTTYKWDAHNQTTFSIRARPKVYQSSSDNHFALPVVLHHEFKSEDGGINLIGEVSYSRGFAYTSSPGPFVNSHLKAHLDISYEFATNHFVLPSLKFASWEFPVSSNPQGPRRDQSFQAQLGYEWRFLDNWSLVPTFAYSFNSSTDKEQNYTRCEAKVGLRFQL